VYCVGVIIYYLILLSLQRVLCIWRQTSFGSVARKEARMSITGVRDVDEIPAEVTQGSDLPPNMSMSTVTRFRMFMI